MKKSFFLNPALLCVVCAGLSLLGGCTSATGPILGADKIEIKDQRLTPEVLWAMGRLGEVATSPSGEYIAYSVRYFSVKENKGNTDLYMMKKDGSEVKQLTYTNESEGNIVWGENERCLYFLRDGQIYTIDPTARRPRATTVSVESGYIEGFRLNPEQNKIAYIKQIQVKPYAYDLYKDLDKTSGMIFNDMNYRHWDEWVFTAPHIFVADIQKNKMVDGKDILEGEAFEAPMKPFGGCEQFCWSPDGKTIVYTSRKLTGLQYATSTNSDLYEYNLESGQTKCISEGLKGYDMNPSFSPSGRYLAWESMERDGYEADKIRLVLLDTKTGNKVYATPEFDQNVGSLEWGADDKKLYFISDFHATDQIYVADISALDNISGTKDTTAACTTAEAATTTAEAKASATSTTTADGLLKVNIPIKAITTGLHDYTATFLLNPKTLIAVRMSMSKPSEIISVSIDQTDNCVAQTQISQINTKIFNDLEMGRVEERWIKTTDGKDMLTWVIYPPHFDSTRSYPTLLYCEGGPQSTVSQFWSFRWNFQIMAANDYIIVAPNRRGLPGFGQEWLEQISGDYSGQNIKDYFSAIDQVSKESYVDKTKLGCVGASYGGYSVYFLAGCHQGRFKAFIAHDGMFNFQQQYLETEEVWFANWDLGGPYWNKTSAIAQRTYANSPHLFVDKWDTPIMIIHGEKDYRILASQGMSAFNAAIMRGLEAELLIFPDENHWVLQPQNGVLWQRRFFRFLDKHVKKLSEDDLQKCHHAISDNTIKSETNASAKAKEVNTEKKVAQ